MLELVFILAVFLTLGALVTTLDAWDAYHAKQWEGLVISGLLTLAMAAAAVLLFLDVFMK